LECGCTVAKIPTYATLSPHVHGHVYTCTGMPMDGVTYPPGVTWCWPSMWACCIQEHQVTELQLSKEWHPVPIFQFTWKSMTLTYVGHNYIGHHYVSHSVVHHNYTPHNYVGHTYTGHTYVGHNYICHPLPLPWLQQQALQLSAPSAVSHLSSVCSCASAQCCLQSDALNSLWWHAIRCMDMYPTLWARSRRRAPRSAPPHADQAHQHACAAQCLCAHPAKDQ